MNARNEIFGKLRETLARPDLPFPPKQPPELLAATRMTVTSASGDGKALAERFGSELLALHASYQIVQDASEACQAVVRRLKEWQEAYKKEATEDSDSTYLLSWQSTELVEGLSAALADNHFTLVAPTDLQEHSQRQQAKSIFFGITGVEAAFASTGSLLVIPAPNKSRTASLLPLYHIVLIPESRLYPTVEAWMETKRTAGTLVEHLRSSSNFTFITGPSKSADLEMILTLGVHGPKFLHAILFDDRV